MNQKSIILTAIILISLFSFVVSAKAAELPSTGTTPDSPLYIFKTWKESIQTFFTFGLENKARQYLHLAEVRLAEYQKMIDKGKTEIAEKTLAKYERQLNRALEKAETMKQKGKDVKDISQKLEDKIAKHAEVLENNLQKAPEAAKKGLEKAIESSGKAIEKITGKPKSINKESLSPKETYLKVKLEFEGVKNFEGLSQLASKYGSDNFKKMYLSQEAQQMSDTFKEGLVKTARDFNRPDDKIKEIQEEITNNTAIVRISFLDTESKVEVVMVREGNAWKVDQFIWKLK